MALSAGAASRSCVLGVMRARMPRRRLFLAVYVCDLEFGICQALCLFIYGTWRIEARGSSAEVARAGTDTQKLLVM